MIIKTLNELSIHISWKMIYIGMRNEDISTYEIIDYAMMRIEQGADNPEIFELAGAYVDDYDYILNLVQDLQENDLDELFEGRKIRLAIVYNGLKKKNTKFIDGLIELTELWDKLGFPSDMPHIVQGRNNTISPSEYYSQENYDELYNINYEWFKAELLYLQGYIKDKNSLS